MNAAKLENSPRLLRVFRALNKARKPLSTLEIMKATDYRNMAIHSDIAELRDPVNGLNIKRTQSGKVHYYQLIK